MNFGWKPNQVRRYGVWSDLTYRCPCRKQLWLQPLAAHLQSAVVGLQCNFQVLCGYLPYPCFLLLPAPILVVKEETSHFSCTLPLQSMLDVLCRSNPTLNVQIVLSAGCPCSQALENLPLTATGKTCLQLGKLLKIVMQRALPCSLSHPMHVCNSL